MEGLHYSFDIPKMALDYEFDDKFMVEHTSIINGEVALVIWQEIMRTIFQKHVHYLLSAVHTGPVEGWETSVVVDAIYIYRTQAFIDELSDWIRVGFRN